MVLKSAPEATKHVDGSVDAKIGMGLLRLKKVRGIKLVYHKLLMLKKRNMGEGLTLNGITFKPMVETVKKK
jgi:hypothetical protein